MSRYLAQVTHDTQSNTLEARWLTPIEINGEVIRLDAECRNYPQEQKAEFEADIGPAAAKYVLMAGW